MSSFRQITHGSDDYQQACRLRNEVLRIPLGLLLLDEDLAGEKDMLHFGLFDDDGTLLACVIAVPFSGTVVKLRQMAVSPRLQGKGVGREVMQELERQLVSRGFREFTLHARVAVQGFYERLGYTVAGEEFIEVGIPHVEMRKRLETRNS